MMFILEICWCFGLVMYFCFDSLFKFKYDVLFKLMVYYVFNNEVEIRICEVNCLCMYEYY